MNIVLIGIIILLLLICIILVTFLIIRNNSNKKVQEATSDETFISHGILDFDSLNFPQKIEEMDSHLLFQACYKVFESFRALDYVHKSDHQLDKIEWHSWQVSLLLCLLKKDRNFFIPNHEKLFNKQILECTDEQVSEHMLKILRKYEQSVQTDKTRDDLSNDIIWTSLEVSFIFYYMINK